MTTTQALEILQAKVMGDRQAADALTSIIETIVSVQESRIADIEVNIELQQKVMTLQEELRASLLAQIEANQALQEALRQ